MTNSEEIFSSMVERNSSLEPVLYKRIVFLSHTHIGGTYRVGSHHLAKAATEFGDNVLHISTPISFLHRIKKLDPDMSFRFANARKLVSFSPGILSYIPRTVLPLEMITKYGTHRWPILGTKKTVEIIKSFDPDIVLIDQRSFQPLLPLIYNPLLNKPAFFLRGTDLPKSSLEECLELKILDQVSGVIGTSSKILENINPNHRRLLLNNGVDKQFLDKVHQVSDRKNMIYVGALDKRFDWDAIAIIAKRLPGIEIDIFGTGSVPSRLAANVHYKGTVNYDALPIIFRKYKFALMPFDFTSTNHGRSPMKLWEYLASGLIVIASAVKEIIDIDPPNTMIYRNLHELSELLDFNNSSKLEANLNMDKVNSMILEHELWEVKYSELRSFMITCLQNYYKEN